MKNLGTYTIKEMLNVMAEKKESTPKIPAKAKKGRNRAKISAASDIQQSMVSSSADATTKLGLSQMLTQLLEHFEQTKASATDQGGRVT